MVTVENIKSGQKVSVIINDRCHPRHAARNLIDLSRAAAQQIGLWGKGAIKVRIVAIEKKHPLDELLDERRDNITMQKLFIAGCGYTGTLVANQALAQAGQWRFTCGMKKRLQFGQGRGRDLPLQHG